MLVTLLTSELVMTSGPLPAVWPKIKAKMRLPMPEQYGIKAALFSDVGTLGLLDKFDKKTIDPTTGLPLQNPQIKDDMGLRASAGLSIFWKSPMGPLRFDFSHILKRDTYDKTELFRFSTSTRF